MAYHGKLPASHLPGRSVSIGHPQLAKRRYKIADMGKGEQRQTDASGGLVEIANQAAGTTLKAERVRAKLKQTELAAAVGVHVATLQRWESGERSMDMGTLFAVCHVLEIPAREFVDAAQALTDKLVARANSAATGKVEEVGE